MATVLSPPEAQIVMHDVSWSRYEQLLIEHAGASNRRLTYDRGTLEIMAPLYGHERCNRLINDLVSTLALQLDIEYENAGSTTFKREDLAKGFEPDSCFYVQNAERIAGKTELNLHTDPPPDVVVEVEITHSALDKLAIFAAVGVPEVWRCDGERIQVLCLREGSYAEQEQSLAFPMLTAERLTQFLQTSGEMPRTAWLRSVRDWARAQREAGDAATESGSAPTL
jgi:Uma2 family endonuclease